MAEFGDHKFLDSELQEILRGKMIRNFSLIIFVFRETNVTALICQKYTWGTKR